ncbi:MAG: hypothetical protein ABL307_00395 [Roseitalea porphyridii]|uniref:hypothetical protein n=1 Tax=Roseitalea porphyridii TaxID=1852022 RepID=UPI0032D8BE53
MNAAATNADPHERIFALNNAIRYVAIYRAGTLQSRQREGLAGASSGESDRYEELLVNPTLLTLARQRGDIDCGGADFVIVGYGNFLQLVVDLPDGHVSVCFDRAADPLADVDAIRKVFAP